jgi:hypothetical protein
VYNQKTVKNLIRFFLLGITLISFGCAHHPREDFNDAVLRLNTPQLIDKYQGRHFSYATTRDGYGCGGVDISYSTAGCSPSYIFHSRKGNCAAYTTFAVYCLQQAGYEAYPLKVYSQWPSWFVPGAYPRDYHYMVLYKVNNKWYVMDNGRGRGPQGINGPFNSIEDLPYKILNIEGKKK